MRSFSMKAAAHGALAGAAYRKSGMAPALDSPPLSA